LTSIATMGRCYGTSELAYRARMRRRLSAVAVAAITVVAGSCTDDAPRTDTTSAAPRTDTTSAAPPTGVTELTDIAYFDVRGEVLRLDVHVPDGDGPWPILVDFHGNSSAGRNAASSTVIAEEAASRGVVVFTASWIPSDAFPLLLDDIEELAAAGSCAVAFAQELAPDFGGDPARTAVHGFSAGAGPAHSVAVDPARAPIDGCRTDALPAPVVAVALSDGEYFFHSSAFDGAFAATPTEMQDRVAAWTDPERWPSDMLAAYSIWAAAEGTAPRPIDDPAVGSDWLAVRDPQGTIRRDLDRLGQLDDGEISYVDAAVLLADRLDAGGVDVDVVVRPGGHQTVDKAADIVDEIVRMLDEA
jgi:acetyl esterase/lipase